MKPEQASRILDAAAADFIPDDTNLLPTIAAHFERKSLMQTLRARPALLILFVFLALSLLTGVAYAVSRSLGYIPGVGLVEQGTPIRVLAEPVTQTRDGITLSVTEAVLTSDKTVILFTLENVPSSALSNNENVAGCTESAQLRMPDGTVLRVVSGEGSMGKTRFVYAPIPAGLNEATFVLPCVQNTLPGLAPENWQLSLRFSPAPSDMTVLPVVEIIATAAPSQPAPRQSPASPTASAEPAPVAITSALKINDFYVLTGLTKQPQDGSLLQLTDFQITDAAGKKVFSQTPEVPDLPNFDWGAQFKADTVNFPVTLRFSGVRSAPVAGSRAEIEFDAGANPQPGQEWKPNQVVQIGGRTLTLTAIRADSRGGYGFVFNADPDVNGVTVEIAGYTANGGGGGGSVGGEFGVSVSYLEMPKGKLHLVLSNLVISGPTQTWDLQWSPENPPAASSLYGITLKLDKFIPMDDGFYLIGHTEWSDKRIKNAALGALKASDASGREVSIEAADWQSVPVARGDNQWVYKIYGKAFNGQVTLRAAQMGVEFSEAVPLTLDLRHFNFTFSNSKLGLPYKTGITALDVPGLIANSFKATYIKEGDMRGFELGIEADPALLGLTFGIESGLNTSGMQQVSGGGGSYRDAGTGLLLSRVTTDAPMSFPLLLAARGALIGGDWSVSWDPPAAQAGATPVYAPQACLTLDGWKQALANPPAIPSGLPPAVLLTRGARAPEPSLFLANLDGSAENGLVFGSGSLSPDGGRLAYSDEKNRLFLLDMTSGQKQALADGDDNNPIWSPDGGQIAFSRQTPKGRNIFVMDADGQNARALTDTTSNPSLAGWAANGTKLLVTDALEIESIDVSSGAVQTLATTRSAVESTAAISPDNQWLAYSDKVTGRIGGGITLERLDGTQKRLLIQLEHWVATRPVFSPDGKWLAFVALNTDLPSTPMTPGLVNLETCQAVALASLNGEITAWVK